MLVIHSIKAAPGKKYKNKKSYLSTQRRGGREGGRVGCIFRNLPAEWKSHTLLHPAEKEEEEEEEKPRLFPAVCECFEASQPVGWEGVGG